MLDVKSKTFMIYVTIKKQKKITIYFDKKAQIKTQNKGKAQNIAQIAVLLFDKAFIAILIEYFYFNNIFCYRKCNKTSKNFQNN